MSAARSARVTCGASLIERYSSGIRAKFTRAFTCSSFASTAALRSMASASP